MGSAISMSPIAQKVNIKNCIFKDCCYFDDAPSFEPCIVIDDDYNDMLHKTDMDDFVKLFCVGNIFEDNAAVPIAEKHCNKEEEKWLIGTHRYILKDNVLKGENGWIL